MAEAAIRLLVTKFGEAPAQSIRKNLLEYMFACVLRIKLDILFFAKRAGQISFCGSGVIFKIKLPMDKAESNPISDHDYHESVHRYTEEFSCPISKPEQSFLGRSPQQL